MKLFKNLEFIIKKSSLDIFIGHFIALLFPFLGLLLIVFVGAPLSTAPLLVFMPIMTAWRWAWSKQ